MSEGVAGTGMRLSAGLPFTVMEGDPFSDPAEFSTLM